MALWETDVEDDLRPSTVSTLPTPMEIPHRTPSRNSRRSNRSNRSRRSVTPPGKISLSPPPMPGSDKTDKSVRIVANDIANDDKISILDPRRFTPTLHANLVSEILTLRRDQEEKTKIIESLESTLHSTREEEDEIQGTLVNTAKENRSLKRQLALLEGGTSSALSELARERDEAVENSVEAKKRLEAVQKRLRTQEEDSTRTHGLWGREKDEWEEERRKMERRVHIAESRLKLVLDEVTAYQAAHLSGQNGNDEESDGEDKTKGSDAGSVRSMSMTNSVRFSVMSKPMNGNSLADELNFDDDSDYQTDTNGRDSIMSNYRHVRNSSRGSVMSPPKSHRRQTSNESQGLMRSGSIARNRFHAQKQLDGSLANGIIQEDDEPPTPRKISYTDTGVQYSPPPSPKLLPSKPSMPEVPVSSTARFEKPAQDLETSNEANQRRKRVNIASKPVVVQQPSVESLMVSSSAQTVDVPLSPPRTPKSPLQEIPSSPAPQPKPAAAMVSAATQTDRPPVLPHSRHTVPALASIPIPSIAIHPPTTRPSTPRESLLPQHTKDFGCQVFIQADIPYASSGTQTEEIRIARRMDRLPAHLQPSAITSRPVSPAESQAAPNDPDRHFTPVPGNLPPRNPRRLTSLTSQTSLNDQPTSSGNVETQDAYPGNNDDGALSHHKAPMRRPHRISSLFAGFDNGNSSDEVDDFADVDMSDTEYRTALSAPRPVKSPEPGSSPEVVVHRKLGKAFRTLGSPPELISISQVTEGQGLGRGHEAPSPVQKASAKGGLLRGMGGGTKSAVAMRKAAMIQSGIATHQEQPDAKDPPFPIPTRASSRQPPFSVSAPSETGGNRSPTRNEPWHRRGLKNSSSNNRSSSIRKVRSAAAVPPGGGRSKYNRRPGSRSPSEEPQTPTMAVPPMPQNDITTPKNQRGRQRGHQPQPSGNTANTDLTGYASQSSSQQAASGVVDAIAQTMVGEWMFKYVRRRKSFGMASEGVGKDDSSNDRHKRWVWLAPYERAILWSSKQPSSGSALLGKSGRKLTIQSVLDVKDDNPAPKGGAVVFNRSILILTPQRALKFTAINAERHYLWLTSLSFLAHSQQAVPEIPTAPAPQQQRQALSPDLDPPQAKVRRPGIRDSIRLAKGRNMNGHARPVVNHEVMPMPSIYDGQSSSYRGTPSPAPNSIANATSSGPSHQREISAEAAEPPMIPRFHDLGHQQQPVLHGRKRSNTGGHVPPPLSFRGFSSPEQHGQRSYGHAHTNSNSHSTAGSSDVYLFGQQGSGPSSAPGPGSIWGGMSDGTSEQSNRMSGNFFDAIGTIRMEAFISPLAGLNQLEGPPTSDDPVRARARRRSKDMRRRKSRSRSRQRDGGHRRGSGKASTDVESYNNWGGKRTAGEEDYFRGNDPFRGF